jgi:hypothetical protein
MALLSISGLIAAGLVRPGLLAPASSAVSCSMLATAVPRRPALKTLVMTREISIALAKQERKKAVLFSTKACPSCREVLKHVRELASEGAAEYYYLELSRLTAGAFEEHSIELVPALVIFDEAGDQLESMCVANLTYDALCNAVDCILAGGNDEGRNGDFDLDIPPCSIDDYESGASTCEKAQLDRD